MRAGVILAASKDKHDTSGRDGRLYLKTLEGVFIYNRQLTWLFAGLILLCMVLIISSYYVGRYYGWSDTRVHSYNPTSYPLPDIFVRKGA
jgi:hypothetical protein